MPRACRPWPLWRPLRPVVLAMAMAAGVLPAQVPTSPREDGGWELSPEERMAWWEAPRRYPGNVPLLDPIAVVREAQQRGAIGSALLAIQPWRSIGPFGFTTSGYYGSTPNPDGGRVRAIAIHPTDPKIVYAGTASGGVWKSTNNGATWIPLTDDRCSLWTGAVALDPRAPDIVYVGTGEAASRAGCGLLRSTDGGATWTETRGGGVLAPTAGAPTTTTYRIVVDPVTAGSTSSTVVLYAASNGLHRSTTSGTSWTTVLSGFVSDVVVDASRPGLWWAARASGTGAGLYKSTDAGATWTLAYATATTNRRIGLATTPAAPGKVWLVEADASSRMGALRMFDGDAATVTTLAAVGIYGVDTRLDFGRQSSYNLVLKVDPADASVVYLGGSRIYKSIDGGATFRSYAYDLHVDWHELTFAPSDPNVVFAGNDGGIYVSHDRGNTWVSRNTNIVASQFYNGIAVHPTAPNVLVGGLQDNSTLWGFASFWTMPLATGDGGFNSWHPTDPDVFFASSYGITYMARITRNPLTGGVTRQFRGLSTDDRKQFFHPVLYDPVNPALLYLGTYRVWRTTNEGVTWAPLTGDLSRGSGTITSIAVSPVDPRVIWVGTSDGLVHVSNDAGATFRQVTTGVPNRFVTEVVASPDNAQMAMVIYSGYGTGKVYLTIDGGTTWTNSSAGLPDIPFNAGVFIPGTARLFVGADIGIYESTDNGTTWTLVSQGMPNVQINDLQYQRATGILYAATYGRGIWTTTVMPTAGVLRGDVDRNGAVTAFDATLAQQALLGVRLSATNAPLPAADANCNGVIDSGDVLAILQFVVGAAQGGVCVGTVQ